MEATPIPGPCEIKNPCRANGPFVVDGDGVEVANCIGCRDPGFALSQTIAAALNARMTEAKAREIEETIFAAMRTGKPYDIAKIILDATK